MRGLKELKKASTDFTDLYLNHIYAKCRFEQDIAKNPDSNVKLMVMTAADASNQSTRQSLSLLDDEIVWSYMTHLNVDSDD